jgi:murein L,D-transpeptidase YcbB/YkuD
VRPAGLDALERRPAQGAPPLAEAIERVAKAGSPADGLEKEKLDHFIYRGLKDELARLETAARQGGWRAIPAGPAGGGGARSARRTRGARLAATGELAGGKGRRRLHALYVDVAQAVKQFQQRHRLGDTGRLDPSTLDAMNVPVEDRIGQVRVNSSARAGCCPD